MSDTDTGFTHCILCGHPVDAHPEDGQGMRPCRSVGHPKGMNCTECVRLIDGDAVAAVVERRERIYADMDSPDARAWAAFNATREHVRYQIGEGWQAFYVDIHQSALASALIEYDKAKGSPDVGR